MTATEYAEREDLLVWVSEGGIIPTGYGVAWRDHARRRSACIPIPLNLLVGWARNLWHWAMCKIRPSVMDYVEVVAYYHGRAEGRQVGYRQGHQDGYYEGFNAAREMVIRELVQSIGDTP